MNLAAIIATSNRSIELDDALRTFENQTRMFDEIIVADSSDSDDTKKVVEKWSKRLPVNYLKCNVRSAALQRDIGVKNSNSEIVYFLDDDVLLENSYVDEIARIFESDTGKNTGGVSGTIINQTYGKPGWITRLFLHVMASTISDSYAGKVVGPGINLLPCDQGADIKAVEWLPGGASAYRRDLFNSIGGFGNFFKGYSMCEDLYLSTKIAQRAKLLHTRKARLFHKDLGGKTHSDWKDIGMMSVVNRWMVVREVLHADTLVNKLKLGLWLLFSWVSDLRALLSGKQQAGIIMQRINGQFSGYCMVLYKNGIVLRNTQ